MDRLARIRRILEARLTTETLDKVYPQSTALEEVLLSREELLGRHKSVRIDLLDHVGNWVEREMGEPLGGEGLALLMESVDRFLTTRGFKVRD